MVSSGVEHNWSDCGGPKFGINATEGRIKVKKGRMKR